jgi:hypothetical protein
MSDAQALEALKKCFMRWGTCEEFTFQFQSDTSLRDINPELHEYMVSKEQAT